MFASIVLSAGIRAARIEAHAHTAKVYLNWGRIVYVPAYLRCDTTAPDIHHTFQICQQVRARVYTIAIDY